MNHISHKTLVPAWAPQAPTTVEGHSKMTFRLPLAGALMLGAALSLSPFTAQAGCMTGAAVGGVAGHVAGHHAVAGAAVGCAIGHHEAKKKARENAQAAQQANPPPAEQPH
jgi:hypothetical protein